MVFELVLLARAEEFVLFEAREPMLDELEEAREEVLFDVLLFDAELELSVELFALALALDLALDALDFVLLVDFAVDLLLAMFVHLP